MELIPVFDMRKLTDEELETVQTIIEWCFECQMEAEEATSFDGISLIEWTDDSKIEFLKEFGCNINNYDPYKSGNIPKFKNTEIGWF